MSLVLCFLKGIGVCFFVYVTFILFSFLYGTVRSGPLRSRPKAGLNMCGCFWGSSLQGNWRGGESEGREWVGGGARSHYGRSHPWRGREENTWHPRPFRIPSMMRSWGKNLTRTAVQDTRDPPGWPRPLPHPVSSPLFCYCSCLPCCRFLCCLTRALLLLFHWIKANLKPELINLLYACNQWSGCVWKKCFNSNPFAGILACLINVCSHCKRLAGDFLQVVNF